MNPQPPTFKAILVQTQQYETNKYHDLVINVVILYLDETGVIITHTLTHTPKHTQGEYANMTKYQTEFEPVSKDKPCTLQFEIQIYHVLSKEI